MAEYKPKMEWNEQKYYFKPHTDNVKDRLLHTIEYEDGKKFSIIKANISPVLIANCLYVPFVEEKLPQYIYSKEVI